MNVGSGPGWGTIIAGDSSQGNIEADGLDVGVQGVVELSASTWLTWGGNAGSVDNLVRSG